MTPAPKHASHANRCLHCGTGTVVAGRCTSCLKHPAPYAALVRDVQAYLLKYAVLVDNDAYSFVAALWIVATYLWPHFDAFPYLVITADTKRAGKTRFLELIGFTASNARPITGVSSAPVTLLQLITDEKPTLLIDEAEALKSEAASTTRELMNVGYRTGQKVIRRSEGGKLKEYDAYCPKAFALIGDPYDTLRDRSIIIRMKRAPQGPPQRFLRAVGEPEGTELGSMVQEAAKDLLGAITGHYQSAAMVDLTAFLSDRDAEIWAPLFAVCLALDPSRVEELQHIAADLATEKTAVARSYSELRGAGSEEAADASEYGLRLLADLLTVIDRHGQSGKPHQWKRTSDAFLYSADALPALYALPTGPWRKFRGDGLTPQTMAALLSPFGVTTKNVRVGSSRKAGSTVQKAYRRADIVDAMQRSGVKAE